LVLRMMSSKRPVFSFPNPDEIAVGTGYQAIEHLD
jgi:hypothetical protein